MGLLKEFKEFAMRGNVIDLAVGVVIGTAFGKIVSSLVKDLIMPPLNLLTARFGMNFNEYSIKIKTVAPVMKDGQPVMEDGKIQLAEQLYPILNIGPFIQSVVDFLLIAAAIFVVIKIINTAKKRFEKTEEAAPKPPSEEVVLLTQIRDELQKR